MTRRPSSLGVAAVATFVLLLAGLATSAVPAGARGGPRGHSRYHLPVLFVHGGAGSAQQYETPAKRFTSNGYDLDDVAVFEYDSTFKRNTQDQVQAALDKRIDELKAQQQVETIDLAAHSLGTGIAQRYLSSAPEHAAKVSHYVNYDGAANTALPGGVPTIAIWGQGPDTRTIVGAENVKLDQSHTQTVTSAESFAAVFRFLNGYAPETTDVVASDRPYVEVAGRLAVFPENYAPDKATLDVYRVNSATGARTGEAVESFAIDGTGNFGPFLARNGANYEFVVTREGNPLKQHWYPQPFVRDDHLVRLLTGEPGVGVGALVEGSEKHSALVITRNKEWWGDQGANNDVLEINGTNVINAAIAPINKRAIAVFAFDKGSDGVNNLATPIPDISAQIFLTAVDIYVPAADQPARGKPNDAGHTVSLKVVPRGGGKTQVINVPNWKSSTDRVSVFFNEY
jgi:pimeloyl-ACP methyl ester carboxylesterase